MIILIPLLIFILSLAMSAYFFNKDSRSNFGVAFIMPAFFSGMFLLFALLIFIREYSAYTTNLATIHYCNESVNEGTIELNETIAINENDKIYNNKFSKTANFISNHDTPIASTQEYLHDIQKDRVMKRKNCLQAKKDVMGFKLGFYGFAS